MTPDELSALQVARFPLAVQRAEAKISQPLDPALLERVKYFVRKAQEQRQTIPRMRTLLMAASTWGAAVAPLAACKRGCSHCCHIPVPVLSTEALILELVSGRKGVQPPDEFCVKVGHGKPPKGERHEGKPCPFLVDGECSVYADRPSVCRTHFNLDDDELLCRVAEGFPIKVPYVDSTQIAVAIQERMRDDFFADIRDFFPGR